jgi:chloramphenicol O-acetyltransferase type A
MADDMAYLDLQRWARRDAFEFFRGFDKPYFNVCVRLDVAALKAAAAARGVGSFTLAYHFIALRLANLHEPFRYRLEGGRVRVHEVVHYLDHSADYASFARTGADAMARARSRQAGFEPRLDATDVIHTTTLPLIPFTSFSHARNWGREDSVPKLAFGRADRDGSRLWMPFSVEVHHALMDGLHVGRYIQAFEEALREPERWLDESR